MRLSSPCGASIIIWCGVFFAALTVAAEAPPKSGVSLPLLSPIFGDHMVLQRDKLNTFWGWAPPGQSVRISVAGKSTEAVAASDGRWQAAIEPPAPGGPYIVNVDAGEHVALHDILVGDVWLCGGQSNMEFALRQAIDGEQQAKHANRPTLRLFQVPNHVAYAPAVTLRGEWTPCTPQTAERFSAVAYFFALKLQNELGIPIGLIESAVGGSPAESWMSADALARTGEFSAQVAKIAQLHAEGATEHGSFLMHWLDEHDVGGQGEAWAKPAFDDHDWRAVSVPGGFNDLGVPTDPAVVWFRREITLPDPLPAGAAKIYFGVIERMDTVYLNGHWIGASSWVENPRIYNVPADALKPGKNIVALRVFKLKPDGGFLSPAATLRVRLGDGREIPLAGEWKAAVSFDARTPTPMPLDFENYPTMPTVLYNGMIAPIAPLAITGALWYQGEANTSRAQQYRKLLPALIADWRAKFGQGEFPFYIVGLPAFMARKPEPSTDGWAELREVQAETVRNLRNTGLAVTIDTGDAENIHPKNKQPVGDRLALLALANHYGKKMVATGPTLRYVERRPGVLALHFNHVEGGLQVHGSTLGEFAIAGDDRAWHWAHAKIEGQDVVVVTASKVATPTVVRYAWQGNPLATLFNGAGLPAEPFRTDD